MKLTKLCFATSIAALFLLQTAYAQTTNYFWTGAGDGATWNQPANWSTGIVPVNNGTTFQIFIGTGFPTPTPTPINISASDHIILSDQLFGPEWGETLNIAGSVNAGFGFAPMGAIGGPKSTVNITGTGSYTSGDSIFVGDPFWFAGGPNVDFNLFNSATISTHFLMVGGHVNLYDNSSATMTIGLLTGTPNAGQFGGISSDATRWVNLAGGKIILPTANTNYVLSLIGRGIFFCYGKAYDTNEFTMTDVGTNSVISVISSLGTLNSVSVQSTGVTNMMVGTFQTASAVGNFANMSAVPLSMIDAAQSGGGTIGYKSSNTNVASVTAAGLINAINVGTTLISVSYSNSTFGSFNGNNTLLITVTPYTNSLIHRYSFSEASGSSSADSVGGPSWDASLNSATLGGGQVALDGSSSYIQLPAGIVANMDAVTVEAWVNFGTPAPFAPLFAFGNQDAQAIPAGMNYLMFQPFTGAAAPTAAALFGLGDPGSGNEQDAILPLVSGGTTNLLGNVHVVAVYHPYAGFVALYTNGVLAAINTGVTHPLAATLGADPLNFLGASLYGADPLLNATINEFRIYNGPLTAGQIAADHALGPDQLIGTSTNVKLKVIHTNNTAVVTWPTTSALVNLMASPVLGTGANWTAANMSSLSVVGTNYQVTVPASSGNAFFRLQQ